MSRLNYLTEEELALDGINQELDTLERLCAEGQQLSDEHVQLLSSYGDRIGRMLTWAPAPVREDMQVYSGEPASLCDSRQPGLTEPAEQEAHPLQTMVRQCLGRDSTG